MMSANEPPCPVCGTLWWNSEGRAVRYTDEEIGIKRWNKKGTRIACFFMLSLLVLLMFCDFLRTLHAHWRRDDQDNHYYSSSTFLKLNILVPMLCLAASLHDLRNRCNKRYEWHHISAWYKALRTTYIVRCLQYLEPIKRSPRYQLSATIYVISFLLWPVVNILLSIGLYHSAKSCNIFTEHNIHNYLYIYVSNPAAIIVWTAFCFLMMLLRFSFQNRQHANLTYLWKNKEQREISTCRRILALYAEDLHSACSLVAIWLVVSIGIFCWNITNLIYWNYLEISTDDEDDVCFVGLNVLNWSENLMYLILALHAVGRLELNNMWIHFKREVSKMREDPTNDDFWDKIIKFWEEQSGLVGNLQVTMMMFSFIGVFFNVFFTDQISKVWKNHTMP